MENENSNNIPVQPTAPITGKAVDGLARIREAMDKFTMLSEGQKDAAAEQIFALTGHSGTSDGYTSSNNFLDFYGKVTALVARFEGVKLPPKKGEPPEGKDFTLEDYVKNAALRQPPLFTQSPDTVERNIRGLVERFAGEGLNVGAYLLAALKQPQLFYQSPDTIEKNIREVVKHFAGEGLTVEAYLQAALKQPQLFCQSPTTMIRHINSFMGLADAGLLKVKDDPTWQATNSSPHRPVIGMLMKSPVLLALADENVLLRAVAASMAGRKLNIELLTGVGQGEINTILSGAVGKTSQLASTPHAAGGTSHRAEVLLTALAKLADDPSAAAMVDDLKKHAAERKKASEKEAEPLAKAKLAAQAAHSANGAKKLEGWRKLLAPELAEQVRAKAAPTTGRA